MLKEVTIPPRSSVIISAGTPKPEDFEGVIEGNQHLLLNCNICVARVIAELREKKATVQVMNFGKEYKHVNKGTTVGYIHEIIEATNAFALADSTAPTPWNEAPHPAFNVNPSLPKHKQEQLKARLLQYKDCFSLSSKVRQTAVAKHHIITEKNARPLRQSPYRVSM